MSCELSENYRYKIVDEIGQNIFFTNSIVIKGDTMGYYNSNDVFIVISDKKGKDFKIDTLIK